MLIKWESNLKFEWIRKSSVVLCACLMSIPSLCSARTDADGPIDPSFHSLEFTWNTNQSSGQEPMTRDRLSFQPFLLAKAPPAPSTSPALEDLGFTQSQTQGDADRQALLDKRSHMLKIHQRLGLITTIPLLATVFLAPGDHSTASQRDIHAVVGLVTVTMYFTTASYAIRAPKVPDTKDRGPIRLHKALAWIHFPGMILTPILGELAYAQESKGEKVTGLAAYHGTVASITVAAYLASILAVSINWGGGN